MRWNLRSPKPLTSVAILVVLAFLVLGAGPCDRTTVDTTYSVSGRVIVRGTDTGIYNASVVCGSFGTAYTDSYGYWSKSGLNGQVSISVAKEGWTFTPPSIPVSSAASSVNFQGQERDYKGLSQGATWLHDVTITWQNGVTITGSYSLTVASVESSGSSTLFHMTASSNLFDLAMPVDSVLHAMGEGAYIIKRTGSTYYSLEDRYDSGELLFTSPLSVGASFRDDALLEPSAFLTVQSRQSVPGYDSAWYGYAREYQSGSGTYAHWKAWFVPYTGIVKWSCETDMPISSPNYMKVEATLRSYLP